ncbi:MAG: hypothetical protein J6K45_00110 [Clostridia bacterium]|nr:hypothetical protein [Clostridia bacterium]
MKKYTILLLRALFVIIISIFMSFIFMTLTANGLENNREFTGLQTPAQGEMYYSDLVAEASYLCAWRGRMFFNKKPVVIRYEATIFDVTKAGSYRAKGEWAEGGYEHSLVEQFTLTSAEFDYEKVKDIKGLSASELWASFQLTLESESYSGDKYIPTYTTAYGYFEGKRHEATIRTTGNTNYTPIETNFEKNNAMAYVLADCDDNAGVTPRASYVNIAFWEQLGSRGLMPVASGGNNTGNAANLMNVGATPTATITDIENYIKILDRGGKLTDQQIELIKQTGMQHLDHIEKLELFNAADKYKASKTNNNIKTLKNKLELLLEKMRINESATDAGNTEKQESEDFGNMWDDIGDSYESTVSDKTNHSGVKVQYDSTSQTYLVGPFVVNYMERYTGAYVLAGMAGDPILKVNEDGKQVGYARSTGQWDFVYTANRTSGIAEEYNSYPHSGETFYIKLKYKEGRNKILGLELYFRYMQAQASWSRSKGEIELLDWEAWYGSGRCDGGVCDRGGTGQGDYHHLYGNPNGSGTVGETHYHGDDNEPYMGRSHGSCNNYYRVPSCIHSCGTSCEENGCTHSCGSRCYKYYCRGHKCKPATKCEHGFGGRHYSFVNLWIRGEVVDYEDIQYIATCHWAWRRYFSYTASFTWDIDLTTTLAGNVWVDKDPQKDTVVNGIRESKVQEENGIGNIAVTVYLYDSSGKKQRKAIAHKAGGERKSLPVYTDSNGYYEINRLEAPGSGKNYFYVVEFEYDGQVYKNTIYIGDSKNVSAEGNASQGSSSVYKTSALNGESKYFNSSMAVEEVQDRYVFDQTFGEITGDSSIVEVQNPDPNKGTTYKTTGFTNTTDVNGNNPSKGDDIEYYQGNSDEEDDNAKTVDSNLVISRLDSAAQNSDNKNQPVEGQYERYRMVASTYYNDTNTYGVSVNKDNFRIQYPLEGWTYVMNQKTSGGKRYINDYMLHINLGLMGRAKTDISVLKDIYKMTVVVNEQEMVQEFNSLGEEQTEYADLKILLEKSRGEGYTLGLYGSDVSYSSLQRYQKAIKQVQDLKKYTELRVFVTYAVRVYNNSETNDVRINEITDYYDNSYTLIDTENSDDIYGYKQNGEAGSGIYTSIVGEDMRREEKCVANTPYYRILSSENTACLWEPTKAQNLTASGVISSGELNWSTQSDVNGMKKSTSTTLRGVKLKVNEYAEIFTTYEIDYDGFIKMAENDNISLRESSGLLGDNKKNIAEVSNYSTFYSNLDISSGIYSAYADGWVSGRVDKDSAPNNIDRNDLDTMKKYEDDTCLAIPLSVELETVVRDMYGYVFEDKKEEDSSGYTLTDGTNLKVGNGIYESGESLIKNVKVSLYEVINLGDVSDNSEYENLEYYYEVPKECYKSANNGFTSDGKYKYKDKDKNVTVDGNYYISEFLAGDYVLRFDYGTQSDSTGTIYTTDDNGVTVSATKDVIKYNGQDYENTSYLFNTGATLNDKYLNLRTEDVNGVKAVIALTDANAYSVARDNESRRMVVDAYSRTIENDRAEILRDRDASNEEFVKATKMFAETPIMQIEILDPKKLDEDVKLDSSDSSSVIKSVHDDDVSSQGITEHTYHISNINFGLEERAKTDIDIEQYIQKIVLQKDGENILSATLQENGEVIVSDPSSAHLDKMTYLTHEQACDPSNGLYQQGFYAIAVEDEYLNGLTIKLTYKMKVINNSEVDFTGYLSKYYKASEIINKATYTPTTEDRTDYINTLVDADTNVLLDDGAAINPTLAEILKLHGSDGKLSTLLSADMGAISTEESDNRISVNDTIRPDIIVYGKYVGRFYYENKVDEGTKTYNIVNYRDNGFSDVTVTYDGDHVVTTTVNQLIDYIDVNASYDLSTQGYENKSWDLSGTLDNTITDRETIPSLDALVSEYAYRKVNETFNIYDEKNNSLVTELSSNIVLSDGKILGKMGSLSGNSVNGTYPSYLDKVLNADRVEYVDGYDNISLMNTNLGIELVPATAQKLGGEESETTMMLTTTKVTSSDTDANNMKFDNLVEVLVYSNSTGRRDVTSVPGNAMALATKDSIGFWKAGYNSYGYWQNKGIADESDWTSYPEDDQYAPEYVTIIAPTGIALRDYVKNVIIPITILSIVLLLMIGLFGVKQYKIIRKRKEF